MNKGRIFNLEEIISEYIFTAICSMYIVLNEIDYV